jgi:hypothetical protein
LKQFYLTISFSFILLICLSLRVKAQETIDYAAELAKLEAELDSMSIFSLIDSVLQSNYTPPSEINFRFGYSGNVVNAGRNYGIDQYGLSPGISFYHTSGLYADYTSYLNSAYDPMYTVSMLSGGYLGRLANKITYSISYERWLYNQNHDELSSGFTNNAGAYLSYDLGPIFIGVDYSYLFNKNNGANRLIGSISGQFSLKDIWIFNRVTFLPTVSTIYGNDDVTIYYDGSLIDGIRSEDIIRNNLESGSLDSYLSTEEQAAIDLIKRNPRRSQREKITRITAIYLANEEVQNYLYSLLDQVENRYGIMSYNLSLPINFSIKNWNWMISYTYALPQSLPGEEYEYDPIGFISTTISYRLRITSKTR